MSNHEMLYHALFAASGAAFCFDAPEDDDCESKTYPAMLDIHGGPRATFGTCFFHQMQTMASDGCFVMFCNPTGSGGRGDKFANIAGRYGTIDYEDLMQFVDVVLEKYPAIDCERLGVRFLPPPRAP